MAQLEAVTSEHDERLPRLATASFVALLAAPDKTALHVATVSVFLRVITTGNREKKSCFFVVFPRLLGHQLPLPRSPLRYRLARALAGKIPALQAEYDPCDPT